MGINALHDETLCCGAAFAGALHAAQKNLLEEGGSCIPRLKIRQISLNDVGENVGENVGNSVKGKAKREQDILRQILSNPKISSAELAKMLKVTERTIERDIARLRETNRIKRQGGDKGGEWIIL